MVGLRKVTPEMRQQILYFHSIGVPPPAIAHLHFKDQISRQTVWRVIEEAKRHVVEHQVTEPHDQIEISKAAQIDHYQPTLESSFNKGLGAGIPWSYVRKVVQEVSGKQLDPYERKAEEIQLRRIISQKDANPLVGKVRQLLKDYMEQLFGFDASSDKDTQFALLDQLARFLVRATVKFDGKVKLNPRRLIEATLIVAYKNTPHQAKVEEFILKREPTLYCPRCKKRRSYVKDKDPNCFMCICGRQISAGEARLSRPYRIDARYVATIEGLLGTGPTQDSKTTGMNN
jgi:hypothetical protein